jgi:hypothetical protein
LPQWRCPSAHVVQPSVEVKRTVLVNMAGEHGSRTRPVNTADRIGP